MGTSPSTTAAARPSVIQLVFRDKATLYGAYMPSLLQGGLFVPTTRSHRLGDEVYLLVALPDDPTRYPVVGTVVWITPAKSPSGRPQGIGVHFPSDEKTQGLRLRIEELLGTLLAGAKPTQTL
jgi:type IV pilus assembly protein PilZ